MKGIFRRTLSFMLSATVLAGTMPMQSYGQEITAAGSLAGGQNVSQTGVPVSIADIGLGADVQILPVSIPEDLKDVSGGENTYLFIGSPQSDVSEKGKYAVTIYRRGNLDTETDFNFKSIDYSASYGEDYRIADDRYQTEIFETNGTLLKQGASPEGQKALEEVYNQVMSTTDETSEKYSSASGDISGGQASAAGDTSGGQASAAGDTSTVTTASSAESKSSSEITASGSSAETGASSTEGKSLAELKQAQTGLPTRETDEEVEEMEDLGALTDMIVQNGVINMGDYTEISSATPIHFDAGEDYKTIVFEILEDDRSEGNEMIEFNIGEVSDGTVLAEPNVASVLIRDDEPLETSTVTFSQKTYRAENGEVTISVKREGADYALATVVAKVEGEGDTGVKELYFQPYITEQTLELRFEPGEKERTYVIDLYDLKGCEEGEITSAKITVPSEADSQASSADSDSSLSSAGASFSDDTLEAVSGVPAEAGNTITVGGHVYVLAEGPDKNTMKIMSKENDQALGRKAQVQVGVYYKPQATDPWKWGLYHGDRPGSNNNYYDAANNFGNLRWYSRWVKDLGGLGGGFVTCMRPFSAYFLDYTSMSKYNSAQVSMTMQNADFGANYSEVNKSVFTGNRHNYSDGDLKVDSRALMGPIRVTKTTGGHFRKEGHSQFEDPGKVPDTKGTKTGLRINVDRTEAGFTEPEAHIYGVVAMYKSVSFSLDSPAPLKYKTATGGTVEEVPATVKLPDTARRFYGESITVDLEASDTDIKVPKGKLAAWEVTPNGGTKFTVKREDALKKKIDYLSADGRTITINDNFIDMLTANGMTVDKSDLLKEGYVMKVTLKPVFEYVTVHVKVQAPTGKGTFKASDLSKMGEYQYHVGDTVNLEATPESGYSYAGYAMKTFRNYDDTNPLSSSELVKSPLNLKFGDSELYVINPVFTTQNNVIEVEMSSDASKYFSIQGLVPDSELSSQLKGKKILKIDNRLSASDPVTQPVPGDAYEIRAVNTAANDGSYRPVFTIKKTGDKVNGYVVDMIAGASQSDNVVVVDAEKVKTADLRYFTLNTKAVYSSSKIRASDGTKNVEPAIGITVKAGGTHVAGYTSEHQKANMVIRSSAVTDTSGKFSIKGIYALPGDTVSVTFDNNDRQQVKYITLPKKVVPVKSTFETVVPNEQTVEMESKSITVDATEINIDQMGMPISSPRAPKIVKVDYSYDADPMRDTLKNFVELRPNEKVNFLAYVNAGSVSIKSVDFIIYDKKGAYRESSTKSITSPLQSGDKNCYKATFTALSELKEGDVLYIQVVSNESKTITYNNGAKSETEYKKYAMIDTGLTFGNVNVTDPPQSFSVEAGVGDYVAKFPFIGEIGRGMSANTGNLTYEKKLVDENNPMTSPFYMTYGMSFSTTIMKRQTDKLKEITNGKHVGARPEVLDVQEKVAATNLEAYANNVERDNLARIQAMADGDEKNSLLANWNSDVRKRCENNLKKQQLKESIARMNRPSPDEPPWDVKIVGVVQLMYNYSNELNTYVFAAGQWMVGVGFEYRRAWHALWVVVPVYFAVDFRASIELDGRWLSDATKKTYAEMKKTENISDALNVQSFVATPTLKMTLMPGVGIYGILGARGEIDFLATARIGNGSNVQKGSGGGVYGSVGGGVGVDLLCMKFKKEIAKVEIRTGIFKENSNKKASASTGSVTSDSDDAIVETDRLELFDLEGEEVSYLGTDPAGDDVLESAGLGLQAPDSIEKQMIMVDNCAEYVRPQIAYYNGTRILTYLSKTGTGTTNIAYSIDKGYGFSKAVRIDPDNEGMDSTNDMLVHNGKVYIAWSHTDTLLDEDDISFKEGDTDADISKAKEVLKSSNIKLAVYDLATEKLSKPITVTNDQFVNSNVKVCTSGDDVVMYYYKRDITKATKVSELISHNTNYSSWASVKYDTKTGTLGKETYVSIKHPNITDPLVLTYQCESCTVDDDEWEFAVYSVDRNLNNSGVSSVINDKEQVDAEIWLKAKNLTENKDFDPLLLDSGNVGDVKINILSDRTMVTWLTDLETLNSFSIDSVFEPTVSANGIEGPSIFEHVLKGDTNDNGIKYSIPTNPFNFEPDEDNTMNISQYQVVSGADGNVYLFMLAPGEEEIDVDMEGNVNADQGIEIYGATYFHESDDDETQERIGWGDMVQVTEYKKAIDEIAVAVDENHNAVMVANIFENTINENGLDSGNYKLVELDCKPVSSLKIEEEPTLSYNSLYPSPGEKVDVSFSIVNEGLIPAENYRIDVVQNVLGNKTPIVDPICWESSGDTIFSGETREYTIEWQIPDYADTPDLISLTVSVTELEKDDDSKEYGTDSATLDLEGDYDLEEVKDPYIVSGQELASYLDMLKSKINSISANALTKEEVLILTQSFSDDEVFRYEDLVNLYNVNSVTDLRNADKSRINEDDWYCFVYLENNGNMDAADVKATLYRNTTDESTEREKLGESDPVDMSTDSSKALVIPVDGDKHEIYDEYGVLNGGVDISVSEVTTDDQVCIYDYTAENVSLSLSDDDDNELELKEGDSEMLNIVSKPYDKLKDLSYTSSDFNVALVSEDGEVTAVGQGTAVISVYDANSDDVEGKKLDIKVTVTSNNIVSSLSDNRLTFAGVNEGDTVYLLKGGSYELESGLTITSSVKNAVSFKKKNNTFKVKKDTALTLTKGNESKSIKILAVTVKKSAQTFNSRRRYIALDEMLKADGLILPDLIDGKYSVTVTDKKGILSGIELPVPESVADMELNDFGFYASGNKGSATVKVTIGSKAFKVTLKSTGYPLLEGTNDENVVSVFENNCVTFDHLEDLDTVVLLKNGKYTLESGVTAEPLTKNAVKVNEKTRKLSLKKETVLKLSRTTDGETETKTVLLNYVKIKKKTVVLAEDLKTVKLDQLYTGAYELVPDVNTDENSYIISVKDKKGVLDNVLIPAYYEYESLPKLSECSLNATGNKGSATVTTTFGGKKFNATVKYK